MVSKKRMGVGALAALVLTVSLVGSPGAALAAPVNYASGKGCTAQTFRASSATSTCARYVQIMLNGIKSSYSGMKGAYLVEDGNYGKLTAARVYDFQRNVAPHLYDDGILGPKTWDELCFLAGQVSFYYERNSGTRDGKAWNAAYNAGCWVEYQSGSTQKFKHRYLKAGS